jgi:N utilization substance protein A
MSTRTWRSCWWSSFTTLEEIAYVLLEVAIEGFTRHCRERSRAKDALLTQAIASEERLDATEPADDLLNMEGMDNTAFSSPAMAS